MASTYVRQGLMPSMPLHPTVVVTICTLELFRVIQLRCPRLGVQAFVRGLCDLHSVAPRPYLSSQFSTAFNVYLSIHAEIDKRVKVALGRDAPNWRLRNSCPACLYKLEGEPRLPRTFISTMDSNNSLKCFWRRECVDVLVDGAPVPGASKQQPGSHAPDEPQYALDDHLSRAEVDEWAKDEVDEVMRGFVPGAGEDEDEGAGCEERWENMKEDVTARTWGMYDETGIFPALCRHGFVLVVVNMVQSGELSKYGFAVLNHLISVLGEVTMGHDMWCKTAKMVKAHPRLGPLAAKNNFKLVVGAFHGLGHGRLCSICNMSMYVNGMGLEDCENCKSYFSKSNALASITRYSTVFHRQQAIANYMKHTDLCDVYQGLTLKMKRGLPALQEAMRALDVPTRDVFEDWLEKEKQFLHLLTKEPLQETQEMEYYQKLVNFYACDMQRGEAFVVEPTAPNYAESMKQTRRLGTQQRHTYELISKSLTAVQDLELRLGIASRWVAGDEDWIKAAEMCMVVTRRRYQRALDQLQGLVVARMFELCKMNMSGTGYKLRKHIAKSLQVRSRAVKMALERYNAAAAAMDPAKPQLVWEKVVEYAFVAEFDLLREGREDIRAEPWALPAGRAAMDQHFKMVRAEEEIQRLDVEIPRLITYMADEREFLIYQERRLWEEGRDVLAYQVYAHHIKYGRFDDLHKQRLLKLSKEPGFMASLVRGVSASTERRVPDSHRTPEQTGDNVDMPDALQAPQRALEEDNDEEEEEEDMDAIVEAFDNIVRITHNATAAPSSE
ncbi:hypothetical protein B0H14DRAFT_2334436 [Mycena olivaceomarginata]|nr:hypothetical protein B0H14DRAFT_2334436 [Mycena olivaceomarginata]